MEASDDIRRIRLLEAARRVMGSISEEEAPYWRTPEDIVAWVRALRDEGAVVEPKPNRSGVNPAEGSPYPLVPSPARGFIG